VIQADHHRWPFEVLGWWVSQFCAGCTDDEPHAALHATARPPTPTDAPSDAPVTLFHVEAATSEVHDVKL